MFYFFLLFSPKHLLFSLFFFLCIYLHLTLCRDESFYCTVPITPVKREVEKLDPIEEVSRVARLDTNGSPCQNARGCFYFFSFIIIKFDIDFNVVLSVLNTNCTMCETNIADFKKLSNHTFQSVLSSFVPS